VGWTLVGAALVALGWLWHLDRSRVWQTPRLGVPLVLALGTAAWVWTLPETRQRNLAAIAE